MKDWNKDEHWLANHLVLNGISAYALIPTTLRTALPLNIQLYLDPESPIW